MPMASHYPYVRARVPVHVDGHAVIGCVSQLLLTDLGPGKEEKMQSRYCCKSTSRGKPNASHTRDYGRKYFVAQTREVRLREATP